MASEARLPTLALRDGYISHMNQAACDAFDITEDIIGDAFATLVHPDDQAYATHYLMLVEDDILPLPLPLRFANTQQHFHVSLIPEGDTIILTAQSAVVNDDDHLWDSAQGAVLVIDYDGRCEARSTAASYLLREALNGTVCPILPPVLHQAVLAVRKVRQPEQFTWEGRLRSDLPERLYDIHLMPRADHVLLLMNDVEGVDGGAFDALYDTALAVNQTLDLNEVLDRVLQNIGLVVPCDMANIMLVDGDTAHIVRHQGYEEYDFVEYVESAQFTIDETPTLRYMVETGGALLIQDVTESEKWLPVTPEVILHSYAAAPIIYDNEVLGFINLDGKEPGTLDRRHLRRLEAFAAQASVAIRNAQLFDKIRHAKDELEARNRDLSVFSHAVAHDLKSPLQVIMGMTDLLITEYKDDLDEMLLDNLRMVFDYSQRMNGIIRNLLSFATSRKEDRRSEKVEMQALVKGAISRYRLSIESQGMAVIVDADIPPALAYGPWVEEVFANLIENAIKYSGSDNPDPELHIYGEPNGAYVRYSVVDNGVGIPADDLPEVFDMFVRKGPRQTDGHGLGLSIVKRLVEKMGGQVGVESKNGEGSTFWFDLPKA